MGGIGQCLLEGGGRHAHQVVGTRVRHRPHQCITMLRLGPIEGQQRQHVGRAEPLARDAGMRRVAAQARGHGALAVALHRHGHAQLLARGRGLAFGQRQQRRVHRPVGHTLHMRREGQRRGKRQLQFGGIDDPGQRFHALRPGGELEHAAGVIALDAHVVDRTTRIVGQRVPDLQFAQQVHRSGIQRIGAHIRRGRLRPPPAPCPAAPPTGPAATRPAPGSNPPPRHRARRHRALASADCRQACPGTMRRTPAHGTELTALSDLSCTLHSLYVHPVKSCAGIAVRAKPADRDRAGAGPRLDAGGRAGRVRHPARTAAAGAGAAQPAQQRHGAARTGHAGAARGAGPGGDSGARAGLGRLGAGLRDGRAGGAVVQRFPGPARCAWCASTRSSRACLPAAGPARIGHRRPLPTALRCSSPRPHRWPS